MRTHVRSNAIWRFACVLSVLALLSACGGEGSGSGDVAEKPSAARQPPLVAPPGAAAPEKPVAPVAAAPPAAAPAAAAPEKPAAPAAAGAGSIAGRITFVGDPPVPAALDVNKDLEACGKTAKVDETLQVGGEGGVANAVVYLKNVANPPPAPMPAQNPVIDQRDCRYEPHVLLVPAGATVDIKNSDGILHNLHTYSSANPPFNAAQPKFKPLIQKKLDEPEFIKLTCDVHGWMKAWVVVHDHPYYALTDASGAFQIADVPPGAYEIAVWHEQLGEKSGQVTVATGQPASFSAALTAP